MIALSYDTAAYELTQLHIAPGEYFDRDCFCSNFVVDWQREPCPASDRLGWTVERLWLNATCGPTSLPEAWTAGLKILGYAYTPSADLKLPPHIADMPQQVLQFTQQYTTDACQIDSKGYCRIKRAIDRTRFCHSIDYTSCQGSCQFFEVRKAFVNWLHHLCGDLEGWHGLPDHWRQLLTPKTIDLIPWQLTVRPEHEQLNEKCPSNELMFGSIVFFNLGALLTTVSIPKRGSCGRVVGLPSQPHRPRWILWGFLLVSPYLFANWISANIVRMTPGYKAVPILPLMMLWCSLPRLWWPAMLMDRGHRLDAEIWFPTASALFVEVILQAFSIYPMTVTVNHGRQHKFYLGTLASAEKEQFARFMYGGALMWLVIIATIAVPLIRTMLTMLKADGTGLLDRHRSNCTTSTSGEIGVHESLLHGSQSSACGSYGTLTAKGKTCMLSKEPLPRLCAIMVGSSPLLWLAQWLFWAGFVGLGSENFCLPSLGIITGIWIASSLGSIIIQHC
jgi:hypothetical protein